MTEKQKQANRKSQERWNLREAFYKARQETKRRNIRPVGGGVRDNFTGIQAIKRLRGLA